MRGLGTVYAGLLVLLAVSALLVYASRVWGVMYAKMHGIEAARAYAERLVNQLYVNGTTVSARTPTDVIIFDPNGVPHVARVDGVLRLPWKPSMVYVVGFSRGVAIAIPAVKGVGVQLSQSQNNYREIVKRLDNISSVVETVRVEVSKLASSYIDPFLIALIADPNVLQEYRGLVYIGNGLIIQTREYSNTMRSQLLPTMSYGFTPINNTWCSVGVRVSLSFRGVSKVIELKPTDCDGSFILYVDGKFVTRIYRVDKPVNYEFDLGGIRCKVLRIHVGLNILAPFPAYAYAYPEISCMNGLIVYSFVEDRIGWSEGREIVELRAKAQYVLPNALNTDAAIVYASFTSGATYGGFTTKEMYVVVYPGHGPSMSIKLIRDDDSAWGTSYFGDIDGGRRVNSVNGRPVYIAGRLVLTVIGTPSYVKAFLYQRAS